MELDIGDVIGIVVAALAIATLSFIVGTCNGYGRGFATGQVDVIERIEMLPPRGKE